MISAKTARIRRNRWFSMFFSPFTFFLIFIQICSLQSTIFVIFSAKLEKEPEPVITEDLQVLALSLMNNTRFKSEK